MPVERTLAIGMIADLVDLSDRLSQSASGLVARHALQEVLDLSAGRSVSIESIRIALGALARCRAIGEQEHSALQHRLTVMTERSVAPESAIMPVVSPPMSFGPAGQADGSGSYYDWRAELAEQLQYATMTQSAGTAPAASSAGHPASSFVAPHSPVPPTFLYGNQPFDSLTNCGPGLAIDEDDY